jgi:hypothetical protein
MVRLCANPWDALYSLSRPHSLANSGNDFDRPLPLLNLIFSEKRALVRARRLMLSRLRAPPVEVGIFRDLHPLQSYDINCFTQRTLRCNWLRW